MDTQKPSRTRRFRSQGRLEGEKKIAGILGW
jgi:hypothetical protein